MFRIKLVSSLEKIFPDDKISDYPVQDRITALKGEVVNVQLAYTYEPDEDDHPIWQNRFTPTLTGSLAEYATIKRIDCIPVICPINACGHDDNMCRTTPGIYPDIISPLYYGGKLALTKNVLGSAWIEIRLPKDIAAGEYTLTVDCVCDSDIETVSATYTLEVINAVIPEEDIHFTQWFHADCLAQYYNVPVWSERHWEIVENFARTAAKNGITMLLTPVFTPPLDTAVGGERLTVQLVDVTVNGGKYSFDFSKVDRWVQMCDRVGIKNLEISHFFTQWGAQHAPKIMANVDGEYKKIFGWETDATSDEYVSFLRQFIGELLAHLKKSGNDKRCVFHVSDEPSIEHIEYYKKAKAAIADLLDGYVIMDALSNFDFYKTGVLTNPIPASNHIEPFLDAKIDGLWTYYCVSQWEGVSNRYVSMPAYRNRSIGMQLYKYNIAGFLQWGYNFYNNQFSVDQINPYQENSAYQAFPAGDSFSVYPALNGEALESTRIKVFYDALQDVKAMKLCEKYYSHEEIVAAMEEIFGEPIRFSVCAKKADTIHAIRDKINAMIKAKVNA